MTRLWKTLGKTLGKMLGLAGLPGLLGIAGVGCQRPFQPATFDLPAARRLDDLAPVLVPESMRVLHGVQVSEIRFTSTSWDEAGAAHPIRIQAFVAVPPGDYPAHSKPGVVIAHGFGAQADAQGAADITRNTDVVTLALSAPGMGGSEGRAATPADPRPLFTRDIRQGWLYAYVYAMLRAISYLQTRPEVDAQAIVMTGFSMGGLATFIANGVDDRIRGALPVAATGGLAAAGAQPDTWLHALLSSAGEAGPEATGAHALFRALDPLAFAATQHGAVYMLLGAQDEYFPLDQCLATFRALRAPRTSLALVADYDHGWYFGGGCPAACMPGGDRGARACPPPPVCPTACPPGARTPYCGPQWSYDRSVDFTARWSLLLRALVAQHAARPPRPFPAPPEAPRVQRSATEVVVRSAGPMPAAVRLAISEDGGWTYSQTRLSRAADGAYHLRRAVPPHAIVFAEVEGADGAVATSLPDLPVGYRQRVRPYGPHP